MHENNHYYDRPTPASDFFSGLFILIPVTLLAAIQWLDSTSVQVLGWIIFPFEFCFNAVFFPAAHTQIYRNGEALVAILAVIALISIINRVARLLNSTAFWVGSIFRR